MESTSDDCHAALNFDDSLSGENFNSEEIGLQEDDVSEAAQGLQDKGKRRRKHTSSVWSFLKHFKGKMEKRE